MIFLAARGEVYAPLVVACLFGTPLAWTWSSPPARLPDHLDPRGDLQAHPALPLRDFDDDEQQPGIPAALDQATLLRALPRGPSPGARASRVVAHVSTAVKGLVPLALLFSHGGWLTTTAAILMLCFHFGILSSIPMGVPLEWNVFMMFSVVVLFIGHPGIGVASADVPPLPFLLFAVSAGVVVLGNLFPRKISFLPGMRYYAGELGHHALVPQAIGISQDRGERSDLDRIHASSADGEVLRQS